MRRDGGAAVAQRVSDPITADPMNVRMRSTGSGAYTGFVAAREWLAGELAA